jgi:hypothetical protein
MGDPLRSEKALHEVQVSLQELEEVLMRIVEGSIFTGNRSPSTGSS